MMRLRLLPLLLLLLSAPAAVCAQDPVHDLAQAPAAGLLVRGAHKVVNGQELLGSGSVITAGDQAATLTVPHRGKIDLCATTTVRLTAGTGLMMSLDRGAIEVHLAMGHAQDVVLTPDFRILLSPPGVPSVSDLRIWLNPQGDTCVESTRLADQPAPSVLVEELFDQGRYLVRPGQRVEFQHGTTREVIDHYSEGCGCPSMATSIADSGRKGGTPVRPGQRVSDNPFPLAESAGLANNAQPVVPITPDELHTTVSAQLVYRPGAAGAANGRNTASGAEAADSAEPAEKSSPASPVPPAATGSTPATAAVPQSEPAPGLFHRIGRWFRRHFGGTGSSGEQAAAK